MSYSTFVILILRKIFACPSGKLAQNSLAQSQNPLALGCRTRLSLHAVSPVFVTIVISTQGPSRSSDFHLNRVSEVKMLNDLSIKKIFFEVQPLTAAKFAWSDDGEVLDGQLTETMRKNSFARC